MEATTTEMPKEIVIDDQAGKIRTYAEVGVQDGDEIIDLYTEDANGFANLRLSVDEAEALIEALTRAIQTAAANA